MAVEEEHVVTKNRSKLIARDSRKVLYSRIGFQKAAASSVSHIYYKFYNSSGK
jgi:hypothetical protein